MSRARARRPKLAVWKFASCDGCQLSILDCEDELLALADAVRISYFPEASRLMERGTYDVSLVEGSITTASDADRIQRVRKSSKLLVAIGACATAGGIQALRNVLDVRALASAVYPRPEFIQTLETSTAIADHVHVDFELRGCPVRKEQLIDAMASLLRGALPETPARSVCVECKLRGTPCLLVARGGSCLGPVTQAGCGALCPPYDRPCYGCFGPSESAATGPLSAVFLARGARDGEVQRLFRSYCANAPAFRDEAARHDK